MKDEPLFKIYRRNNDVTFKAVMEEREYMYIDPSRSLAPLPSSHAPIIHVQMYLVVTYLSMFAITEVSMIREIHCCKSRKEQYINY